MKQESIRAEISAIIRRRQKDNQPVPLSWVCHEFMSKHGRVGGEDVEIYRIATYKYVRDIAKRVIGKFDMTDEDGQMELLPGHEHIRTAYSLKRGDEIVLVPVEQCTDQELLERANEFERASKGLVAHATEIRIYVGSRRIGADLVPEEQDRKGA